MGDAGKGSACSGSGSFEFPKKRLLSERFLIYCVPEADCKRPGPGINGFILSQILTIGWIRWDFAGGSLTTEVPDLQLN